MRDNQSRHLRVIHSNSEAITRNARLSYLKDGAPDFVSIPDAHFSVRETINREILAKLPILKVIPAELTLPIPVSLELINHDRTIFAAMPCEIGLPVTIQVELPGKHAPLNRVFPDRGAHSLPLPRYFTRKPYID
jgi:hypothetical protein